MIDLKNPNPKKGSVISIINYLENSSFEGWSEDSKNGYLIACNTIKFLLQANGETPEVDNPVPSLDNNLSQEEILFLSANAILFESQGKENSAAVMKKIVEKLLQNGRETDKEKLCPICKLRVANSTKGLCNVCHEHW
jgi:hypothetical protein